jgi:glycosyltransferase involved in cell wall biosynthesis
MRVVVLPSWYPAYEGDTNGIFFREQARALAAAGVDVTVIAPQHQSWRRVAAQGTPLRSIPGFDERLAPYRTFPQPLPGDRSSWTRAAKRAYSQYVNERGVPDVLHAHSLYRAGPMSVVAEARVKIVTEHAGAFMSSAGQDFAEEVRAYVPTFDRRIAVGAALADRLNAFFPNLGRWECIPNSVDTDFFAPADPPSLQSPVRIFAAGNLLKLKRFDLLISAFDRALGGTDAVLIIAGSGPEEKALRQLASRKQSCSRIFFLGHASRQVIRDEMQNCTLFALASRRETFGVVLIEAMACGKPVVSTDSGGPRSVITDDRLGMLVEADDESALADALSRAVADREAWDRDFIRSHAVSTFSQRKVTSELIALYEDCLTNAS